VDWNIALFRSNEKEVSGRSNPGAQISRRSSGGREGCAWAIPGDLQVFFLSLAEGGHHNDMLFGGFRNHPSWVIPQEVRILKGLQYNLRFLSTTPIGLRRGGGLSHEIFSSIIRRHGIFFGRFPLRFRPS